jgi:hypothetical protein
VLIAPEAANVPSRRVLEKNGFHLVEVRPIATEPHRRPMAVYRLAAQVRPSGPSDLAAQSNQGGPRR